MPSSSREPSASPHVPEVELESALFASIVATQPLGTHKHLLILDLQNDLHKRTGAWFDVAELWRMLHDLYDLEALDEMHSSPSPSIPPSPDPLSPIPNPSRRRPTSSISRTRAASSPLTDSSDASPPPGQSRSAAIIDSPHFAKNFEIPPFRSYHDWSMGETDGLEDNVEHGETDDEDQNRWAEMVYDRALGDKEEASWEKGVAEQRGAKMEENKSKAEENEDEEEDEKIADVDVDEDVDEEEPVKRRSGTRGNHESKSKSKRKIKVEEEAYGGEVQPDAQASSPEAANDSDANEEEAEPEPEPEARKSSRRKSAASTRRRGSTSLSETETANPSPVKGHHDKENGPSRKGRPRTSTGGSKRKRDGPEESEDEKPGVRRRRR